MGVKREDEGAGIRRKLWLREKAIMVGETDGSHADGREILGTVRSET